MEIMPWLLTWGAEVEVLTPTELREDFSKIAGRLAEIYGQSSRQQYNLDVLPIRGHLVAETPPELSPRR